MSLFDFLKPQKQSASAPEKESPAFADALMTLEDMVAPNALKINPRNLMLGNQLARSFFVVSYPRFLNDGWLEPVFNMERELDVSIIIHPINTVTTLKKLQKKVAEVESQISVNRSQGKVRDPKLETAHQDIETLRDELQQGEQKLFDVGLYVTLYASSLEVLKKSESELKGILDSRLIYVKPAQFQQDTAFKSVVPILSDELTVHSKHKSSSLSSFFPFTSFDLTSDSGILYGINRHNSSLVLFDRFSLTNYNSVTFATSGAGKSYTTKLEILRSLMFETEVIVVDPEREYEYLAETTGGRFFNISLTSEHHINPFDLPAPSSDEEPVDVLRSHIIELIGLFRLMLQGLSPEEETIVDQALHETYALKDITGVSDFSDLEAPLLSRGGWWKVTTRPLFCLCSPNGVASITLVCRPLRKT